MTFAAVVNDTGIITVKFPFCLIYSDQAVDHVFFSQSSSDQDSFLQSIGAARTKLHLLAFLFTTALSSGDQ